MGQQQSVQIQSEINQTGAAATSRSINNRSAMEPKNLNGQKTSGKNETSKVDATLKTTISDISSEGHDVVDDYDSTTYVSDVEEDDFESDYEDEEEKDEEFEGKWCPILRQRSFSIGTSRLTVSCHFVHCIEFLMERKMILQDARNLALMADFYYSPEKPVTVNGTACARCYFDRPSAADTEALELQEEREMALQEAAALKNHAMDYLQPERPVQVSDATACARSYFDRYSAPVADADEEEEYQKIMEDLKQLKVTATWYLHPEKPVECDGFAMGRDYYSRPSAEEYDDDFELDIERERIMKDMAQLKTTAEWYLKPELPVAVDATCFGRNYFSRPSAPEQTDLDEDARQEHERILQDLQALKTTAEWYLKPELPVVTSDPTACGRNYFSRASAPEYDEEEDADERAMILADAARLKQVAGWYMHPEKPVVTSDPTACARNYFNRASAPETEDDMEERDQVLAEMAELKKIAGWYMHPEQPVVCEDPCAFGRNYFERASAPLDEEEEEERQRVLAEAAELKKIAGWYMHPEKPVVCDDACATARNYFTRPSAPEFEEEDEMNERERVLSEALEMKKYADWYLHPEKPVQVDGFATARNYFSHPNAAEQEEEDLADERQRVLAEAKKLKEVAEWYHCPEKPVRSDGFASGRNYFTRPSAPEQDRDAEDCDSILADAKALKKVAEWYHCPEKAVEVDATACARNFFSRPSAPEYESEEASEERNATLADASKLKEVAEWYHHPETPVTSNISVTRSYFTRPSAEEHIAMEQEQERAAILADAMQLKKLAVDYLHPEKPVVSSVNCVRNYFDRPSAPGHTDHIHTDGHSINEHSNLYEHHVEQHDAHHDYYHYHDYGYHHDDDHSHGTQSDHFEMDEDVYHNFRQSMVAHQEHQVQTVPIIKEIDEKEGNLSRSPSDVMLFDESAM